MMLRQSSITWIGLAGIILFLIGVALNQFNGHQVKMHLKLGTPVNQSINSQDTTKNNTSPAVLPFTVLLDSLRVSTFTPTYELQVREVEKEFEQQFHPNILRPSQLVKAYSLQPMKIRKIGDTEYRFRLKQFYPDFTFQYTYPEHQDTIAPKAPGITLNLKTREGEQAVTLQFDQSGKNRLVDVVQLGCALEFFWTKQQDSRIISDPDSTDIEHKIIFLGEDKKIKFQFNGKIDTVPLELNHFYGIPGRDSLGFTILQCFPDASLLKAVPATRSEKLNNPVAGVEVWKRGGYSQEVFIYPTRMGRPGGQWEVPGTQFVLALAVSHQQVVNACQCSFSIADSSRHVIISKVLDGHETVSYVGNRLRLVECDPGGFWAILQVQKNPGKYFKIMGFISLLGALLARIWHGKAKKTAG